MDAVSKQISQDVDSGRYFSEAREWYNVVFIKPAYESAIMYLYAICAGVVILFSVYNLNAVYPGVEKITVVTKLGSTLTHYPKLKILHSNYASGIAEYIAGRYVKARESYDPRVFPDQYKFVYRQSSQAVFSDYSKFVAVANPQSPLVLYGWKGVITVDINNIKRDNKNNLTVIFTKKGHDNYNNLLFVQDLEANITYEMGKLSLTGGQKVDFSVKDYQLKEIKS